MAASIRDIRRRMKSVESTGKLTRAMELVSSAKLRRARERAQEGRDYVNLLRDTAARLAAGAPNSQAVNPQKAERRLFIVIAGDRGLAGGFNLNLFRAAKEAMGDGEVRVLTIGKKAGERYGKPPVPARHFGNLPEVLGEHAAAVAGQAAELYRSGEVEEIVLCYTRFLSALRQQPVVERLLPIQPKEGPVAMEFDPSAEAVLSAFLPLYLQGMIAGGAAESYAAEQAARRLAMETAGDNARDLEERLALSLNRARQSAITQELSEIVGGSALGE